MTTDTTLSRYEFREKTAKNVITIPSFLEGDFGKDFMEEFQGRAKTDYRGTEALKVLKKKGGLIINSNYYSAVLANQILRQVGLRTPTQADAEKIRKSGELALEGFYIDTGLVLRSEGGEEGYLSKGLMIQLQYRRGKQKLPIMIPLSGLYLKLDCNTQDRLSFVLREDAEIIYDEILNEEGKFDSDDINKKTGLPTKLKKDGDRDFLSNNQGLAGICLYRDSGIFAGRDIIESKDCGRIIVVKNR